MTGPRSLPPYVPIDCGLHDRLEALATLQRPCTIAFRDENGQMREVYARIVDVLARDGAEHLRTDGGLTVRLDRLASVDGVAFGGAECD